MSPQKKDSLVYAGLTLVSVWVALLLAAAAGRALTAGYVVSTCVVVALASAFLGHALLWAMPRYLHSLSTLNALQAGLRNAEEIARSMAAPAPKQATPAGDQPMRMPPLGSAVKVEFDADSYWRPTWQDADLSHAGFQRSIDEASRLLWRFPLILLRDRNLGRLVALRNSKVRWVEKLGWGKMEAELTIAEIKARVGRWIDGWEKYIPGGKASAAGFEKAVAVQSKESHLAWLDGYLRGTEKPPAIDNTPDGQAGDASDDAAVPILDLLTGELPERDEGRERLCETILKHKPACIPLDADVDDLPRGMSWKMSAVLERFVLELPAPGWVGVVKGTVAMMYDDSDPKGGNGSLLDDREIAAVVSLLVFEATDGLSEAAADIRQAVMNKELLAVSGQ